MNEEQGALDGLGVRPAIDYRALLVKYIRWVGINEGVDFIDSSIDSTNVGISSEEWTELRRLAAEARHA